MPHHTILYHTTPQEQESLARRVKEEEERKVENERAKAEKQRLLNEAVEKARCEVAFDSFDTYFTVFYRNFDPRTNFRLLILKYDLN